MSEDRTLRRQGSSISTVEPSFEAATSQPAAGSQYPDNTSLAALGQKMTFVEQSASNRPMKHSYDDYVQSLREAIESIRPDPNSTFFSEKRDTTTRKDPNCTTAKRYFYVSEVSRRIQRELAALEQDTPPVDYLHLADRTTPEVYESILPQSPMPSWPSEIQFTKANPKDVLEQQDIVTNGTCGSLTATNDSLPRYFAKQESENGELHASNQDEVQKELNARFFRFWKMQNYLRASFKIPSGLAMAWNRYFKKSSMETLQRSEDVYDPPFRTLDDVTFSYQDVKVPKTYGVTNINGNSTAHLGDSYVNNYFLLDHQCVPMKNHIAEQIYKDAMNKIGWNGFDGSDIYSGGGVGAVQKETSYPKGHDAHQLIDPIKLMDLVLNNITGTIGDTMSKILTNTMSCIIPLIATHIQAVQCWHN